MGATMSYRLALVGVLSLALAVPAMAAQKSSRTRKSGAPELKLYKWVDANGVTHYGDKVPPEYASTDRVVMNRYAVPVDRVDVASTDAERLALKQAADAARAAEIRAQRDKMLLSTYVSVQEIEALRDSRLELMDGQAKVTENYLASLRSQLKELQKEASAFKPYSADPEADVIDEKLSKELADTLEAVSLYEHTLKAAQAQKQQLAARFSADISRFKELRQIDAVQP
jgi:Domain of unknown function (DUF4124)